MNEHLNPENATQNNGYSMVWETVHKGIIAFAILHVFIEYALGNTKTAAGVVLINYLLSRWYAKRKIKAGAYTDYPFWQGVKVSFVIFLFQLLLGIILELFILR